MENKRKRVELVFDKKKYNYIKKHSTQKGRVLYGEEKYTTEKLMEGIENDLQKIYGKFMLFRCILANGREVYVLRGLEGVCTAHKNISYPDIQGIRDCQHYGGGSWLPIKAEKTIYFWGSSERFGPPKSREKLEELVSLIPEIPIFKNYKVIFSFPKK